MISKVKFLEKTSKSVFVAHFSDGTLRLSSDKDYNVSEMKEFFLKHNTNGIDLENQKKVVQIDFIKSVGNHATIIESLNFT